MGTERTGYRNRQMTLSPFGAGRTIASIRVHSRVQFAGLSDAFRVKCEA
jgi:hypothetical protein